MLHNVNVLRHSLKTKYEINSSVFNVTTNCVNLFKAYLCIWKTILSIAKCIAFKLYIYFKYMHSLGLEPMTNDISMNYSEFQSIFILLYYIQCNIQCWNFNSNVYIKLEFKRHRQSGLNGPHSPHSTRSTCQSFHLYNVRDDYDKYNQVDNNEENYYNDCLTGFIMLMWKWVSAAWAVVNMGFCWWTDQICSPKGTSKYSCPLHECGQQLMDVPTNQPCMSPGQLDAPSRCP